MPICFLNRYLKHEHDEAWDSVPWQMVAEWKEGDWPSDCGQSSEVFEYEE